MRSCKLPDASAKRTFSCACGDTPYQIIPARSSGTWEDGEHWCSGTLAFLGYDGGAQTIFNPYSLDDLRAKMASPPSGLALDAYLECVSTNTGTCAPPADPVFQQQQVSMVAVFQRCLQNYASKQWDLGSYVLYNSTLRSQIDYAVPAPAANPCLPLAGFVSPTTGTSCLGDCLLYSQSQGSDPSPCLDYLLQGLDVKDVEYFEYANASGATASNEIDACQVWSGLLLGV